MKFNFGNHEVPDCMKENNILAVEVAADSDDKDKLWIIGYLHKEAFDKLAELIK